MPRVNRRFLALGLATAMATSMLATTTPVVAPVAIVSAASPPWTLPTRPPVCTEAQTDSGNVGGCVINLTAGIPEDRGWPAPPFPDPIPGTVIPWVNLAKGATGIIVAKVQEALNARGADLEVDGQFGNLTEAAVKSFQTSQALPSTGIVDATTAARLGVQNTTFIFPPPGWNWLGWGYNGSPALTGWEGLLRSNAAQIGSVKKGAFRSLPEALPLFEGFLAEIQIRGYAIVGGTGAYVFRCTASTSKDCNGLTRHSLSNHSYGLATDINVPTNPMKTYYGINGASACATPMQTNMPQWVIQTAEKWGLYWGGYGWSTGCTSPSQFRTSVTRDAMHFEFNGSPQMARQILRFNVGGGACYETATNGGSISEYCLLKNEVPPANSRIVIDTDAPPGATAALVNLTTTSAATNGFLTAEGCGAVSATREWSNANARPGRATAALTVVPIDAQGRFCLYQSAAMHTLVDVQGFFAPAASAPGGSLYTPVTPTRTLDTREMPFCDPSGACTDLGPVPANTEVANSGDAPVAAVATVANVTVVRPSTTGYLTADGCPGLTPGEQPRSNVNFVPLDVVANLSVVPSDMTDQGAQFCVTATSAAQHVIDVQGYFAPAAGGGLGFTVQTPDRLVNTRECWTDPITSVERCNQINDGGSLVRVRAPAGATAVMVNVTTVQATTYGYASVAGCAAMQAEPPSTSNVNAVVGAAVPNTAIVPVDPDGTFCVYVSSPMHVVVDLLGTFSAGGSLRFVSVTPVRVHDTRVAS